LKYKGKITQAKRDFMADVYPEKLPCIWQCPAPEDIKPLVQYTFNLNPSYQPEIVGAELGMKCVTSFLKEYKR